MALLPVSCKNGTKFVRNSYEIRATLVRNSYEIRPQSASQIGTVNVVVTNFVRISHEVQTICMNLCHLCECVGVPGRRGCCLCGCGCMVCACLGDAWVLLLCCCAVCYGWVWMVGWVAAYC